jgi:hypothetical protein
MFVSLAEQMTALGQRTAALYDKEKIEEAIP